MEEINVTELLKYYLGKLFIVIIFIIIGILGSWYYTANMQVPMYKSETSLVLTRANNNVGTISQTDVNLNKSLVSTYREIIRSRRILSKVIKNLDLSYTESKLKSMIGVTSAKDTELMVISVKDEDAKEAKLIANEIAKVFKEEIISIYSIENISIVDKAVEATNPYNINIVKQYLIGFGLGLILGSGIVFMMFYFDDTIKSQEDIESKVGLSVLTSVPKYRSKKNKKKKDEEEEEVAE